MLLESTNRLALWTCSRSCFVMEEYSACRLELHSTFDDTRGELQHKLLHVRGRIQVCVSQ